MAINVFEGCDREKSMPLKGSERMEVDSLGYREADILSDSYLSEGGGHRDSKSSTRIVTRTRLMLGQHD